jgi:hypothetical protein
MEDEEPSSPLEERCLELIIIARQWEEQISDLRSFSQIEKETLESEITSLQEVEDKNTTEKQSLENSMMTLEDERVSLGVVAICTMVSLIAGCELILLYAMQCLTFSLGSYLRD